MNFTLEPLRTPYLSNFEAGQLISRHLTDLDTIDAAIKTDIPFNSYVQALVDHSATYTKALQQIQKNENTKLVFEADAKRDRSVTGFGAALKLYSYSEDEAEVEAARRLKIIYKTFKKITVLNYEAESQAIDKLLLELATPEAVANINRLNIASWVSAIQVNNNAFKDVFSTRIQGEAVAETFSMKAVRQQTYATYSEFTRYVLAMANATQSELFTTSLSLINTARAYYANILARRKAQAAESEASI